MAEKWKLEGSLADYCNCTTVCPCNYLQVPTNPTDCKAIIGAQIKKGNYGPTKLDGLHLALVAFSKGNPLVVGIDRAAMILDERATPDQRKALGEILGGKAGGLFAILGSMIKTNLGITWAKFDQANDGKAWFSKAGKALDAKAGFLTAPKEAGVESKPLKIQTYDPFFAAPNQEKIVGISERLKVDVAGLAADVSGKYSSSGNFSWQGP